jgi:hypothetical protein
MKVCFKCGTAVELEKVGRRDECPRCGNDLRVCLNCAFYDAARANACMEPQVEPVKEKDRANYCDFFRFREINFHGQARGNLSSEHGEREGEAPTALPVEGATRAPVIEQKKSPKAEAEKLWNDLFKKR